MSVLVYFTSSPVEEVWGNGCFTSLPLSNVLPPERHLCASLADVEAKYADWKDRVKATGKPAVVCCCLLNAAAARHREVA